MMQKNNPSDHLSYKLGFIALAVIAMMIGLSVGAAIHFNNQRRISVIRAYDQETTQFVENHSQVMKQFFTETFDLCRDELGMYLIKNSANRQDSIECNAAQIALASTRVYEELKDSSAIAYVRYADGNYELIEASGNYNEKSSLSKPSNYSHFAFDTEKRLELEEYLSGKKEINRWQDFIAYISGKEVVVPVVIDGQTVGFIFRGVMER